MYEIINFNSYLYIIKHKLKQLNCNMDSNNITNNNNINSTKYDYLVEYSDGLIVVNSDNPNEDIDTLTTKISESIDVYESEILICNITELF